MAGRDQVPLGIDLLQAPEQEAAQAPGLFYLTVHRLDDRFALGVDRLAGFGSELAGHAGFGVSISGQSPSFGRWRLAMRQAACGDVVIDAALLAVLRVGLAPVARIQRHDDRQVTSAGGDPFQHWRQVFNIRRLAVDAPQPRSPGVRYPQWLLLLMAILGILSGCRSARDLEPFAKRHHQAFGAALGLELPKAPRDSTSGHNPSVVGLNQKWSGLIHHPQKTNRCQLRLQ